jgi:hypothetical protein
MAAVTSCEKCRPKSSVLTVSTPLPAAYASSAANGDSSGVDLRSSRKSGNAFSGASVVAKLKSISPLGIVF